jgi:thioredoxin 1
MPAEESIANVSDQDFDTKVLKATRPVLVDFWAPWCGPCLAIAPTLESLASEFGDKVSFLKLDVEENPNVPASYGVRAIPFIALFKEGKMINQVTGPASRSKLAEMIQNAI